MMKFVVLILAVAAAAQAEFAKPIFPEDLNVVADGRIISGEAAAVGQLPWQASLLTTTSGGNFICGGSLISTTWVLTAAHCIPNAISCRVGFGVSRISPAVVLTATRFIMHPAYNPNNLNNDIALVGLPSAVALGTNVAVIRLPTAGQSGATFAGLIATVSGFGRTTQTGGASEILRFTTIRIITNAVCQQTFGSAVIIGSTVCGVGDPNPAQSTCNGDSGGPLVINEGGTWTQIGVVSFVSSAGCGVGAPSGYVRTASFLNWINSNTGIAVRP